MSSNVLSLLRPSKLFFLLVASWSPKLFKVSVYKKVYKWFWFPNAKCAVPCLGLPAETRVRSPRTLTSPGPSDHLFPITFLFLERSSILANVPSLQLRQNLESTSYHLKTSSETTATFLNNSRHRVYLFEITFPPSVNHFRSFLCSDDNFCMSIFVFTPACVAGGSKQELSKIYKL